MSGVGQRETLNTCIFTPCVPLHFLNVLIYPVVSYQKYGYLNYCIRCSGEHNLTTKKPCDKANIPLGHTTDITGFIIPDVHVYSHHWKASGRDQPEGILTGSPVAFK